MKQQEKGFKPIPEFIGYPFNDNCHCQCPDKQKMEPKHIFLRRDQFFFDIKAQLMMVTKARRREDGTEDELLSNATNTFKSEFDRWITKHIGIAKGIMAAFVKESKSNTAINGIKDNEESEVLMEFPIWYDDTTFQQLSDAVHDYVVNAVLFEFLSVVMPNDPLVAVKKEAMEEAKQNIKKFVNAAKPGMLHKKFSPF